MGMAMDISMEKGTMVKVSPKVHSQKNTINPLLVFIKTPLDNFFKNNC